MVYILCRINDEIFKAMLVKTGQVFILHTNLFLHKEQRICFWYIVISEIVINIARRRKRYLHISTKVA